MRRDEYHLCERPQQLDGHRALSFGTRSVDSCANSPSCRTHDNPEFSGWPHLDTLNVLYQYRRFTLYSYFCEGHVICRTQFYRTKHTSTDWIYVLTVHDWNKTKVAKTGATTITVYQVQRQVLPSGTHINLTREQNSQALRGSGACSITGTSKPAASGSERMEGSSA